VPAGADRLHIWAGWHEATRPMLPMFVKRGAFSHLAAEIKKVVDVPVSTVGRINDPYVAADILAKGEADLIGLGRTLLCDPDFVKKTLDGRTNEIRRCTACCYCFDQIMRAIQ
ncbi:MAG: NADH oxidase, partial [Deltaproteobacteria bacterium]|nr:NADH oxidase [Deltaproteobacteria bacterium]